MNRTLENECDLAGWTLVNYILCCHIIWWLLYGCTLLVTKQKEEWCCRFVTLIHGCLISYSAMRDIIVNEVSLDFEICPLSRDKKYLFSYMLSYFLFDYFWIRLFGNETWVIYVHHGVSIVIITHTLLMDHGYGGLSYSAFGLEITNPYLQLRWFLRTHGLHNTIVHRVIELWFIGLFFVIRIIAGTVILFYALLDKNSDIPIKLSTIALYGVSWVLQWQIITFFRRKYLTPAGRRRLDMVMSVVSMSPFFPKRRKRGSATAIADSAPSTSKALTFREPEDSKKTEAEEVEISDVGHEEDKPGGSEKN